MVTLLVDNQTGGSPTTEGAKFWKDKYALQNVTVVSDPTYALVPGSTVGTPQLQYVNPRTQEVTFFQSGYSGDYSDLIDLAWENKNLEDQGL